MDRRAPGLGRPLAAREGTGGDRRGARRSRIREATARGPRARGQPASRESPARDALDPHAPLAGGARSVSRGIPLALGEHTRALVLTGDGISASSGLLTVRGAGGLWEGHPVEEVASPEGFRRDPRLVWRFYSLRRSAIREVAPNPAHHALVALEERLGDRFLLVTQ